MLKTVKKYLLYLADYIAPRRVDAALVGALEPEDIVNLPTAPNVEKMDWIHPLFHYKDNRVRAIVWELKYRENTAPLETIGELLYDEIMALVSDILLFDGDAQFLLIPIPISTQRRRERGYNQSEYIAKSVLARDYEHFLLYAPQWLEKIRETATQNKSASRHDRMQNLLGCFSTDFRIDGSIVILIDDVVTTGSTLSEARKTLLSSGARNVFAFTVAH